MKTKDLEKLKSKTSEELTADLKNSKENLWTLKAGLQSGKVKNVRELRQVKKTIAIINTLLRQKQS